MIGDSSYCFHATYCGLVKLCRASGASFRRGDFAPREPEFGVKFWDANF